MTISENMGKIAGYVQWSWSGLDKDWTTSEDNIFKVFGRGVSVAAGLATVYMCWQGYVAAQYVSDATQAAYEAATKTVFNGATVASVRLDFAKDMLIETSYDAVRYVRYTAQDTCNNAANALYNGACTGLDLLVDQGYAAAQYISDTTQDACSIAGCEIYYRAWLVLNYANDLLVGTGTEDFQNSTAIFKIFKESYR
ncbi:MAG: hypothetical protein Q8K75_11365 [Chlamydiales bacterium]|nr:hypothetical protein [Chlamydiales bacterium]